MNLSRSLAILSLVILSGCELEQDQPITPPNGTSSVSAPSQPAEIDMAMGERVYRENCATCHDEGTAGAPRIGDTWAWEPRIQKGMGTLLANTLNGFQGNAGVMPPRGGAPHLSDSQILAAVTYLVQKSEKE